MPSTGSVLQGAAGEATPTAGSDGAGGLPGAPGADESGVPTDAALAAQRLATLETELAQVRAEQERLRLALETVNTELTQTREQTTSLAVVYGLVALLLLLLGVLVWLLRSRSAALAPVGLSGAGVGTGFGATRLPSSMDNQSLPSATGPTATEGAGAAPAPMAAGAASGPTPWWADSNSAPAQASGFSAVELDSQPSDSALGFSRTEIEANSLPLMAQDLADLVRQVEFFEVLGQSSEAVDALQAFVKTHPAQSELPYLLLMQVMQKQDPQQLPDLQRLYMRHYDQPAPQPADCDPDAPGLLEDPIWITRLQQVWPHAAAGTALQAALTAPPAQNLLRRRTLPALLDVVTLYEVWYALHEPDEAADTSASQAVAPASAPVPEAEFPAIDIDLTAYTTAAQPERKAAGSAAATEPVGNPPGSKELPALDFDVGDFPEVPDSRLDAGKDPAPKP